MTRSTYYWTPEQERLLARWYGRLTDREIAELIGRPVTGLVQKAQQLGIRKHGELLTTTHVAELFGVSTHTVTAIWVERGWLRGQRHRGFKKGPHLVYLFHPDAIEAFIRYFPMRAVPTRMPRSHYRALAIRVRSELPLKVREREVRQLIDHRRCLRCFERGRAHRVVVAVDGSVTVLSADGGHAFDPGERRLGDRRRHRSSVQVERRIADRRVA